MSKKLLTICAVILFIICVSQSSSAQSLAGTRWHSGAMANITSYEFKGGGNVLIYVAAYEQDEEYEGTWGTWRQNQNEISIEYDDLGTKIRIQAILKGDQMEGTQTIGGEGFSWSAKRRQ